MACRGRLAPLGVEARILNLLARPARDDGLAIVMITHDMSTVAAYADRIAVMYLGRIVETGHTRDVLRDPKHPNTEALLSMVPVPHRRSETRIPIVLTGATPDPGRIPPGCRFHPRCQKRREVCDVVDPALVDQGRGHGVACPLYDIPS